LQVKNKVRNGLRQAGLAGSSSCTQHALSGNMGSSTLRIERLADIAARVITYCKPALKCGSEF